MDYAEGLKKEVAEVKFLIHDLRVRWFFDEVIHYHVTLNTDLEIHGAEQAQVLHGADLDHLRGKGREVRQRFREYSDAVKNFSPDKTVLAAGRRYVDATLDMCELILNPLWGRIDRVLSFLPPDSRSALSRNHYRNCLRWICGVHYRIEHFLAEEGGGDVYEEFDVAEDLQDFTRNVVYGYVVERSASRVELRLDRLDRAVLGGKRHRFRRMFFSLIMNAVDALAGRKVGMINVSAVLEDDRVAIRVRDNGSGMSPEKIEQLLAERETLDGELHSLGFVFVRQTVDGFGGTLEIESEEGQGTTITVRLPHLPDATPMPRKRSDCEELSLLPHEDDVRLGRSQRLEAHPKPHPPAEDEKGTWGQAVLTTYRMSDAPHPGCIFAIAVTGDDEVDFFTHRPYERLYNITHEDLSPMFFEATVRGRLEEDEEHNPVLILKAPQNVREYFEFKGVPEDDRSAETYVRMVHDEYIRVARKLLATGMDGKTPLFVTDIPKLFPDHEELQREPFALEVLARQKLNDE